MIPNKPIYLPAYLPTYLCLSVYICLYNSVYLPVDLSICLYVSVCLSENQKGILSVHEFRLEIISRSSKFSIYFESKKFKSHIITAELYSKSTATAHLSECSCKANIHLLHSLHNHQCKEKAY